MAFSKVTLNGTTLMDVTQDTVVANKLLNGITATAKDGVGITGNIATKTSSDLTSSGATVTVPAGYYASNASKTIGNGAVTVTATKAATKPTIAKTTTTASGATNVGGSNTISTSAPSSGFFISVQATAPVTSSFTTTKTVNTAGYISANTQITATNIATTATTGDVYYLPITTGVAQANTASVTKVATDGSAAGVNITGVIGTATTTEPSSGYYAAFTGSGSSKVTTAGWFPTGALPAATSSTTYFPVTGASFTFSGGALNNKAATATLSSGFITDTADNWHNGLTILAKGTAGRAAVTYTNTAGYYAAHSSATNASSAVSASTWDGTTYYIKGIKLTAPSSGKTCFDLTIPNGNTTDFITWHFEVDTAGNVLVTDIHKT